MTSTRWIAIVLLAATVLPAHAQTTKPDDKEGVSVTVYNSDLGVIRELRMLDIQPKAEILFTDVPAMIDPTSVHFKSLTDPTAKLLEQNYRYDLVNSDKLLQKYIDQQIEVVCKDKTYAGTLMTFDPAQIILKEDKGGLVMVQRADNVRDIRFKSLPEGLLTRPTLLWQVQTAKPGKQLAEVTYQTGGMTWHAEYVLVLNPDDTSAGLNGWISVQNNSGKTYKDAVMKFVGGDVRRVTPQPGSDNGSIFAASAGSASGSMEEKTFFEYHMYTLDGRSTVADNEVKQLEMFAPASGIKVQKMFLYDAMPEYHWYWDGRVNTDESYGLNGNKKVAIFVQFKNEKENKLGMPLPAGKVRCYKQDPADKALEFIGEEEIDHTPRGEEVSLQVGNAFDLVGERRRTAIDVKSGNNWMSESFEIKVRNQKEKEDVVIRVKEHLYRWTGWKITAKSTDFKQLDAQTIVFDVPVKAKGETVVTYTVEYQW